MHNYLTQKRQPIPFIYIFDTAKGIFIPAFCLWLGLIYYKKIMQKTILLLLAFLIAFTMAKATTVDTATARLVAYNFYNQHKSIPASYLRLSFTGKTADGDAAYYAFSIDRNGGFVIVSADDAALPILGYSLTGRFEINNASKEFLFWMNGYTEQIYYIKTHHMQPDASVLAEWNQIKFPAHTNQQIFGLPSQVLPLINTHWDQSPFYNDSCPGLAVTGCVATTMAQIMKFWNYPLHGKGNTTAYYSYGNSYNIPSVNLSNVTYNWYNMPEYIDTSNADVARLMYDCGVSVRMNYSLTGSGAWVITADNSVCAQQSYVQYFGYDSAMIQGLQRGNYTDAAWINLIQTELNAGRPVQYVGSSIFGGHTWVCDGYDAYNLFHMNWGWSGVDDGYYNLDNLIPKPVIVGFFIKNQEVLIGIVPPCPTADVYITGAGVNKLGPVAGNTINAFCTERNSGKATAVPNTIKLYLSANAVLDTTKALPLGQITVGSLSAQAQNDSLNTNITIPAGTAAGQYYLFFVADANQVVSECNRANNIAVVVLGITTKPCNMPVNDEYTGAISLNYSIDSCTSTLMGSSCGATASGYKINDSTNADDDVFYQFIPTQSNATITVKSTAGYDAVFQLMYMDNYLHQPYPLFIKDWPYTSCINNTRMGGVEAQSYTGLIPGNTYYIRVWHSKAGWGTGDFSICVYGNHCVPVKAAHSCLISDTTAPGQVFTTKMPTLCFDTVKNAVYGITILKPPYDTSSVVLHYTTSYYYSPAYITIPAGYLHNGVTYRWNITTYPDWNATCSTLSDNYYFTIDTTSCPTPSVQADSIVFVNISPNTMQINWTKGNSSRSVVKVNTNTGFSNFSYGDSTSPDTRYFWSSYEQVIYDGTGNTAYVYGLSPLTNYCFKVYAANCKGASSVYNNTVAVNNPLCQQTCIAPTYPDITSSSGQFSVCKGGSITLTANAPACQGCTYTWGKGITGTSIVVSPQKDTNYTVTVTNGCGTLTNSKYISVNATDTPQINGYSNEVCKGTGTGLSVNNYYYCYNCTYQWSDGKTGSINYVIPDTTTVYTVKATNSCGIFTSAPFTVKVVTFSDSIGNIHGKDSVAYNTSYHYTTDSVPGASSYQWQTLTRHGATMTPQYSNNPFIDINWVSTGYLTDSLMVNAYIAPCGWTKLSYKRIKLPPCTAPFLSAITSSTGAFSSCNAAGLTLSTDPSGCYNCNYIWSSLNYLSYGRNIYVKPVKTTTYKIKASNGCLPDAIDSQTVVVNNYSTPIISLQQNCTDSVLIINASASGTGNKPLYMWKELKNGIWNNIATTDSPSLRLTGIMNGTQIKCILYSNDPCRRTDTASSVIFTNCTKSYSDSLSVWPNPNNGKFSIYIRTNSPSNVSQILYNSVGQELYHSSPEVIMGSKSILMNNTGIASGSYYLVIMINGKKNIMPLFIIK